MIVCKHCSGQFEDHEVMLFVQHLRSAHDLTGSFCLGNHGECTTTTKVDPLNDPELEEYKWIQRNGDLATPWYDRQEAK